MLFSNQEKILTVNFHQYHQNKLNTAIIDSFSSCFNRSKLTYRPLNIDTATVIFLYGKWRL